MEEHTIETKRDLENLPERARVLRVSCSLSQEDAARIMRRCRLLEEVVFDHKAFRETDDDVKKYLNRWVFVESTGRVI